MVITGTVDGMIRIFDFESGDFIFTKNPNRFDERVALYRSFGEDLKEKEADVGMDVREIHRMITNWETGTKNPEEGADGVNVALYIAGDLGAASFMLTVNKKRDAHGTEKLEVDWREGKEYIDYVTKADSLGSNNGAIRSASISGDIAGTNDVDGDAQSQKQGSTHKLSISKGKKTSKAVYKCFAICLVHSTPKKKSGKVQKEYIAIGGQNGRLIVFDVEKENEPVREAKLRSKIGNGSTEIHAVQAFYNSNDPVEDTDFVVGTNHGIIRAYGWNQLTNLGVTLNEVAHKDECCLVCTVSLANRIRKGRQVIIADNTDEREENIVDHIEKNDDNTLGVLVILKYKLKKTHGKGTRIRAVLTSDQHASSAGAGASAGGEGTDASSGDATMDQQETAEKRTEEERTIEGSKGRINAVCFSTVAKPLYEFSVELVSSETEKGNQIDVASHSTFPTWHALFDFLEGKLQGHPLDKSTLRECVRKGEQYEGWMVTKQSTTDKGNPGVYVFTGGADATVKMLDATTGKQLHIFRDHAAPVLGLTVSEDQKWLLSCSEDKRCMLYNIELLRERLHEKGMEFDGDYFHPTASFGDALHSANFDSQSLFSQSSVDTEKQTSRLGHVKPVNGGLFARGKDPAFLVTFGQDNRTLRYNLASIHANPMLVHKREPIGWDLEYAGNRVLDRDGASDPVPMGAIRSACFDNPIDLTAPQRFIFTASEDKALRQYNVDTGGLLRIIVGHTDYCTACILSRDNRFLFSGSLDKTVAMYHIPWAPTTMDLKFIEDAVSNWFLANDKSVKADDFIVGAQIYLGDSFSEVVIVLLPTMTGGDGYDSADSKEIKTMWNILDKFEKLGNKFLENQPDASTQAKEFLKLPTAPWDSARENRITSISRICVVKKSTEREKKKWGHMINASHARTKWQRAAGGAVLHAMNGVGAASAAATPAEKEIEQKLKDDQQLLHLRSCNWDLEERERRRWMNDRDFAKEKAGHRRHRKKGQALKGGAVEELRFELAPGREMRRFLQPTKSQGILQIQVTKDDQYVFASGTAGVVHQYNVETSLCIRTFQPANNRFPIPDFALAPGKQYRYSRERERVAIEGEQLCKKRWTELSAHEKSLLDDTGCFSSIEAKFDASSDMEIDKLKSDFFGNKVNHGDLISKAFISQNVAQVPDQHLVTVTISGLITTYDLATDSPIRRYRNFEKPVQNMWQYNSKTHNCIITMGRDAKQDTSAAAKGGDSLSVSPSSIASSFMSRDESTEEVSVMKLVHRDTGTVIRLPERKIGVPWEAKCFCVPACHLNKEGVKRVGKKFAAMYIHSIPNPHEETWEKDGSRFIELFDLEIVLRKMKEFEMKLERMRREIDNATKKRKSALRSGLNGTKIDSLNKEIIKGKKDLADEVSKGPDPIQEANADSPLGKLTDDGETIEYLEEEHINPNPDKMRHRKLLLKKAKDGEQRKAISHFGPITQILVSPNGKYIMTASLDCTVKRCPLPKAEKKRKEKAQDDPVKATATKERERKHEQKSQRQPIAADGVDGATEPADGSGNDKGASSDDDEGGETQAELNVADEEDELKTVILESHKSKQTHDSGVLCMCISPDSNHVVTGGADGVAHHWIMERRYFKEPHISWLSVKELDEQIKVETSEEKRSELKAAKDVKEKSGNVDADDANLDTNPLHYANLDHSVDGDYHDGDQDVFTKGESTSKAGSHGGSGRASTRTQKWNNVSQIYKVVANKMASSVPFVVTAADDNILRKFVFAVNRSEDHNNGKAFGKKWTPLKQKPQMLFGGHNKFGHQAKINALEMTEDDRYLITGANDELIKIWDVQTGNQLRGIDIPHRSPRFTLKLSSGILSLEIDSTNEGVLLVGLSPQTRVQGDGAYKETLHAIPQLHALLYEGVIPSSFLELMARVDEKRHDPDEKYRNLRRALKRESSPMATSLSSKSFYLTLADEANTLGLVKALFDFDDMIQAATIPYSQLLEAVRYGHETVHRARHHTSAHGSANKSLIANMSFKEVDWIREQIATEHGIPTLSRDYSQCVREILRNARLSVTNHNMVHAHRNKPRLQHSGYTVDNGHMVLQLTGPTGNIKDALKSFKAYRKDVVKDIIGNFNITKGLLDSFPDEVLSFLSKVPNMRSDASVNHPAYGLSATMKANSMLVIGATECISTSLWYDSRVATLIELKDTWGWVWRSWPYRLMRWVAQLGPRFSYSVLRSSANLGSGVLEGDTAKMNKSLEILWRDGILSNEEAEDSFTVVGVRKRGTESCVLPWPHFATGSMLLRKLLDTNDTEFFAPTIVVALVQHKWQTFGRPRFTQDLFVYTVSLILMVTASIINRTPGVLEKFFMHHAYPNITGVNMTAIFAVASASALDLGEAVEEVGSDQDLGGGV